MHRHRLADRRAQGMTEYIIIVVLVAIAVLAGVKLFGGTLLAKFGGSTSTIDSELQTDALPAENPAG